MLFASSLEHVRQLEAELESVRGRSAGGEDATVSRKRQQLQLACRTCILAHPTESHAESIDATLWRHCFYLPIDQCRRQLKNPKSAEGRWALCEVNRLIDSGLAFLATLLHELCTLHASSENCCTDKMQAVFRTIGLPPPDLGRRESSVTSECMQSIVYRLLIFCGDLARYRSQFNKAFQSDNFEYAWRIYSAARRLAPDHGHACNQLAVVCSLLHDTPLTIFWYLRAVCCAIPFAAAQRNAIAYLDKVLAEPKATESTAWLPLFRVVRSILRGENGDESEAEGEGKDEDGGEGEGESEGLGAWFEDEHERLSKGEIFTILCMLCSCAMTCPCRRVDEALWRCVSAVLERIETTQISNSKDDLLFLLILVEIVSKLADAAARSRFSEFLASQRAVEFSGPTLLPALELEGYLVFPQVLPILRDLHANGRASLVIASLQTILGEESEDLATTEPAEMDVDPPTILGTPDALDAPDAPGMPLPTSQNILLSSSYSEGGSGEEEVVVFQGLGRAINN